MRGWEGGEMEGERSKRGGKGFRVKERREERLRRIERRRKRGEERRGEGREAAVVTMVFSCPDIFFFFMCTW